MINKMINDLFPKYRIDPYKAAGKPVWGISERCCFFWYKHLTHMKFVLRDDIMLGQAKGSPSFEVVTWKTEKQVKAEVKRLESGQPKLKSRTFHKGRIVEENYG